MDEASKFLSADELELTNDLLENGYVIRPVACEESLTKIRNEVVRVVSEYQGVSVPKDPTEFLESSHSRVLSSEVNDLRLHTYRTMNKAEWLREAYFKVGRPYIETIVGNELAMQNRVNLSIQMPQDRSSVLDLHADVFSGESPYEVVQWLPLVNVSKSQSMFFLPRDKSQEIYERFADFKETGMTGLFEEVKDELKWLEVPFGSVVIFSPICFHGNKLNEEGATRWSLNCRLKSLFSPYTSPEKSLGSFYLPLTPKPVSRIGAEYVRPTV